MAKKKNSQSKQQPLSPEQYLKQRARSLKIGKCYMSNELLECGEGLFIITRLHPNGKVSIATFLVDIYCLGVKDSVYHMWLDEEEAEYNISKLNNLKECSYEELHNWIYGAVAFAEEGGIEPDRSFNLTQYMLEEDTDDIPLIEYEFGQEGQHLLICNSVQEANLYIPKLKKNLDDSFKFIIKDDEGKEPLDFDLDEETIMERLKNFKDGPLFKSYGPATEYTYQHPAYPNTLELTTPDWFYEELHSPSNRISLDEDFVNRILELPHELVRENLEKIILYHIGLTCENIPDDYDADGHTGIVSNSVILLGEVGNTESSLNVILEILRQNGEFYDYHFGDVGRKTLAPTIFLLGKDKLELIMDFVKEEGLYSYCKYQVFPAITQIALQQPERRKEIIEWYRRVIRLITKMLPKTQWFDSEIAGLILSELIDLQAKELLPEIKKMFETNLVDIGICGDYFNVCRSIVDPRKAGSSHECILDVRERFADIKRAFGH